jgi:hypothetical protein
MQKAVSKKMPWLLFAAASVGGSAWAEAPAAKETVASAGELAPAAVQPVVSSLAIPEAPPDPIPRRKFAVSADDPSGAAARDIAHRVPHFHKYRAEIAGATWSVDESAVWSIRSQPQCLRELDKSHVKYALVERELTTPVPTLVKIDGPIEGVRFDSAHPDREVEVSCELAARLPAFARLLRERGVRSVLVASSYRDQPRASFHTFGMALDIAAFRTAEHNLIVAKHFEMSPGQLTCKAEPHTPEGQQLLAIACALAESHMFSSVLTPNYNEGHRDHFHLDVRPDDARFFVR